MVLIEETGEDSYFHLKVWIFHCLFPRSFYQQDHEMKNALPTSYRFSYSTQKKKMGKNTNREENKIQSQVQQFADYLQFFTPLFELFQFLLHVFCSSCFTFGLHCLTSYCNVWFKLTFWCQIHTDKQIKEIQGINNYLTKYLCVLLLHVSSTFRRLNPHSSFSLRCWALTESSFISKLLICRFAFSRVASLKFIKWGVVNAPH